MYFFPCLLFSLISNVKQTTPLPLNSSSTNKTNQKISKNNRKLCARAPKRMQSRITSQPGTPTTWRASTTNHVRICVVSYLCACVLTCVFVYLMHCPINRKHTNTHSPSNCVDAVVNKQHTTVTRTTTTQTTTMTRQSSTTTTTTRHRATLGQGIRTGGGTVVPIASGIGMIPMPGDRRNTGSLRVSTD